MLILPLSSDIQPININLVQIFFDQKVQLWTIILAFVPHEYFLSYARANIYAPYTTYGDKILRSFQWRLWHREM